MRERSEPIARLMPPSQADGPSSVLELRNFAPIAWSLVGRAAMIGAMVAINGLMARLLDREGFGQFLLCLSVISVAGLVGPLGVNALAVRRLTIAMQSVGGSEVWPVIAAIFAAALIGGCALVLAMIGPGAGLIYQIISAGRPAPLVLLSTALWSVGYGLQLTLAEVLRAAGRIRAASFAGGTVSNLVLAAMLGLLWLAGRSWPLEWILACQAAIVALSLLAFVPTLFGAYAGRPSGMHLGRVPELVWAALPAALLIVFYNLIVQADVFALGRFRPGDVGIYGAANRLVLLLTVPGVVLEGALTPAFASRLVSGERRDLERLAQETACVAFLGALPILCLYVLGGRWLTATIFGSGYAESGGLLAILACGYMAASISGPALVLLILSGRQRLVLAVFSACMIPYLAAVTFAARFGGREIVAVTVMAGIWEIFLALVLTARGSLGVWTFATPAAMAGALRGAIGRWRRFRGDRPQPPSP
jgi:O-antigen/teichoic acid export membrane protein